MKILFQIAFIICITFSINAQTSNLPLFKAHDGGDTTVQFMHDFSVHGRTFTPVGEVTVKWKENLNKFTISGNVTSTVVNSIFQFYIDPSLFQLYTDSSIITYFPNVIDTFQFEGQKFLGLDNLTFYTYNTSTNEEYFYGDVKVVIEGESYKARMGSSDDPGGKLQNNELEKVWIHIEDLLKMKGLVTADMSKTDIILRHKAGDPSGTYYGYGLWAINLLESLQIASLGTATKPGLIIKNSVIDSVTMIGGGGGFIFGVLPVLDGFMITYNHVLEKYVINGLINVGVPLGGVVKAFGAKYAPSFVIDATDLTNPGFLLDPVTGKFAVADALFILKGLNTASKVTAGGFEITNITLGIKNNWPDSIYAQVAIPPGISLAASLGFILHKNENPGNRFFVNNIDLTWQATTFAQALPVGTTGFSIVRLGGGVENLNDPANLTLVGDIGLVFGEPASFNVSVFGIPGLTGEKELAIVYIEGIVHLSAKGMSFQATGNLGALYQESQWLGLVADLEAGVHISWGGKVSLDATLSAYASPNDFMDATATASFNKSGDIDAVGSAFLKVPDIIPVIGGKHIAGAHFALRHKQSNLAQSYAAAWTKFNLIFDHITAGAKANFKSGHVSKIGAAEAKAITQENISDNQQHPIGANGQPDPDWYACGITHHFTLNSSQPPAYLQNQLVIENNYFHNAQQVYFSPAIATITSPSSSLDLKILTPDDPDNIYLNQGQTTPQDNTLAIDFTMLTQGGFDTIKFITVNQAAEAYGSIDWVHQPALMLTPGEYVLTVSGYCPEGGFPLSPANIKYNVSPIYPRPTDTLFFDEYYNLVVNYSSYITDSTTVSLYWNFEEDKGGNLIGHLNYHDGELIGDSTYQWVVSNWFPGLIPERYIYFYAVIDDHINPPVQSNYISYSYDINLVVTVAGGTDSTSVLLSPADTLLSDVYGINNGGGNFIFANVPLGAYTIQAFSGDSIHSFGTNMQVSDIDGNTLSVDYHAPEWASIEFDVLTWDNGQGHIYFELEEVHVPLFGEVTDTSGLSLEGTTLYLLDEQGAFIDQANVFAAGYRFANTDTGFMKLAIRLPISNEYHWPPSHNMRYITSGGLYGLFYVVDSVELNNIPKAMDFRVFRGPQGPYFLTLDNDNNPVENVVITIHRQDGTGPTLQAVSDANGFAFFDGSEVATFTNYYFSMAWPQGYHTVTPQGQTFQWTGTTDPHAVIGDLD